MKHKIETLGISISLIRFSKFVSEPLPQNGPINGVLLFYKHFMLLSRKGGILLQNVQQEGKLKATLLSFTTFKWEMINTNIAMRCIIWHLAQM